MKKSIYFILFFILLLFSSCFNINKDPLAEIRRISRSSDLKEKEKASELYQQAIDTMVDAYISLGSLNKAIGEKLMFQRYYKKAIKHLEIARDIRNEDANLYFWLGVCYVNLYKNENNKGYLSEAEHNYKTALRLMPDHMDILYSYAHFLVYAKENYEEAVKILNHYIYELNPSKPTPDPKAYFLLGRVYYILGNYKKAYDTYNEIYKYKNKLTTEEKEKLEEFILETGRTISGG